MFKFILLPFFVIIQIIFSATLTPLYISGPDNNRIKLVIMGDGFDTSDQNAFNQLADTLFNGFCRYHPWKTYFKFINFYRINTISPESGVSIDYSSVAKNTTFNTHITENLFIQANTSNIRDTLTSSFSDWNILSKKNYCFFIINSREGIGNELNPDVGAFDFFYHVYNTGLHELGHGFADLADEYTTLGGQAGSDIEPNVSFTCNRDSIKWKNWINPIIPLPTPDDGSYLADVGAFTGAKYQATGIYRPQESCMMRDVATQYCRICTEAIVLQLHRKLKMYDSYYPNWSPVGFKEAPDTFKLSMVDTEHLQFSVKWFLDNAEIPGANGFTYVLDPNQHSLGKSTHQIKCRFRDTTWYGYRYYGTGIKLDTCPFVRTDPDSVMTDSVVWTLEYGIGIERALLASASTEPTLSVFTSGSVIRIQAAPYGNYQLGVYDIRGRLIKQLGQGIALRPIEQTFQPQSAGMYIVRLIAKGRVLTRKAVGM